MKTINYNKFFKVCPKSGRIVGIRNKYLNFKILVLVIGFFAALWYLIRVIPKPDRVTYPCMQVATPFAFSFFGYLSTIFVSAFGIRNVSKYMKEKRWFATAFFAFIALCGIFIHLLFYSNNEINAAVFKTMITSESKAQSANVQVKLTASDKFEKDPYTDKTVVRVYEPTVTTFKFDTTNTEYFWHTYDTEKLQSMLENGIMKIADKSTPKAAWKLILPRVSKSSKIAIKVNLNNVKFYPKDWYKSNVSTPPAMIALIRSLEQVGVQQSNITFFDQSREFPSVLKEEIHAKCPNVVLKGINEMEESNYNFTFSEFEYSFKLPKAVMDAEYFIDLCVYKYHNGGISGAIKNLAGLSKSAAEVMHRGKVWDKKTDRVWEENKTCRDLILNAAIQQRLKLCICEAVFGSLEPTEYLANSRLLKIDFYPNNLASSMFISRNPYLFDNVLMSFMNYQKSGSPNITKHTVGIGWIKNCADQYASWSVDAIAAGTVVDRGGNMPPKELGFDPKVIEFISVHN